MKSQAADNPGRIDEGAEIVVPPVIVQVGVVAYYKVNGFWPDSWSDVVAEGFWQTPIPSKDNSHVNPDDRSIDFYDDVYYAARLLDSSSESVTVIMGAQPNGSPPLRNLKVEPPKTYFEFFGEMDGYLETDLQATYGSDTKMKKLFGLLGEMQTMMAIFFTTKGRYPSSLNEFFESGLSPVNYDSINPVTGLAFRFDGSAGDVMVTFDEERSPHFVHINQNGELPPTTFSY